MLHAVCFMLQANLFFVFSKIIENNVNLYQQNLIV